MVKRRSGGEITYERDNKKKNPSACIALLSFQAAMTEQQQLPPPEVIEPGVLYLVFRGDTVTHFERDKATGTIVSSGSETNPLHSTRLISKDTCFLEPVKDNPKFASIGWAATSSDEDEGGGGGGENACWFEFRLHEPKRHQLTIVADDESNEVSLLLTDGKLDLTDVVYEMQHEAGPMQALLQHRRLMRHVTQPDTTFFTRICTDSSSVHPQPQPTECPLCAANMAKTGCRDLPPLHPRYGTEKTTCQCKRLQTPCHTNCVSVACVPCGHMYACGACALAISVLHQDHSHQQQQQNHHHSSHASSSSSSSTSIVQCNVCDAPVWHFVSVIGGNMC
jgi:hypothetical protein